MRPSDEDTGAKTLTLLVVAVTLALGLLLIGEVAHQVNKVRLLRLQVDQLEQQVQSIQRQQQQRN